MAKTVPIHIHEELQETNRELRFKLKAMSLMLKFLKDRATPDDRSKVNIAIFSLTLHMRGEKQLTFVFNGETITVPERQR